MCKTFLLSKVWFMLNFVILSDNYIKDINKLIFRFIWNSPVELVKRDTLILPFDEGGLNMFKIEAKIETIFLQNFLYFLRNYERDCYSMSFYWMKFELKDMKIENFNIMPSGDDRKRPTFYQRMISCVKNFKRKDKDFIKNAHKYNSKKTYELFRKKYEKKPNCEIEDINSLYDWKNVYKSVISKKFCSEVRSFNYKLLNNGVSLDTKIQKLNKKCHLCSLDLESTDHLFLECSVTKKLFKKIKYKMCTNITSPSKDACMRFIGLEEGDLFIMSIFNMSIWRLRNILMVRTIRDIEGCFLGIFKYYNCIYK